MLCWVVCMLLAVCAFVALVFNKSEEEYPYEYIFPIKERYLSPECQSNLKAQRTDDEIVTSPGPLCANFPYKWSNGLRNKTLDLLQAAVDMFDEIGTACF